MKAVGSRSRSRNDGGNCSRLWNIKYKNLRVTVDSWNGVFRCFLSGYNSWLLLTGLWSCSSLRRFPAVRRCSLRPAATPSAGGYHCPARHVHRSRPVEQPRQRLPVLLCLHHDMLLPASRNCRTDLFNPSEFNLREWRLHPSGSAGRAAVRSHVSEQSIQRSDSDLIIGEIKTCGKMKR